MRKTNVQMGALVSTEGSIGTARVTLQVTRNPKRPPPLTSSALIRERLDRSIDRSIERSSSRGREAHAVTAHTSHR